MEEDNSSALLENSASSLLSSFKRQCESCAICKTTLKSSAVPKLLPCLHAVCGACIPASNEDTGFTECPMCGQRFTLSEVTDCFIFKDYAPKCGGCDVSSVCSWCKQCEEALCSDCVSAHLRVRFTRNHTVIPLDPASGLSASLHCILHKHERLRFFCLSCEELTCKDCQLIGHRGHSFLLLEEAFTSQKEELTKMLHRVKHQKASMTDNLQDLDERLNDLQELKSEEKQKLTNMVHLFCKNLKTRSFQLSNEIESFYNEEEKCLRTIKSNLNGLVDRQEYISAFIQRILSTKNECILLHKKQITKRVQSLLSQNTGVPDSMLHVSCQLSQHMWHFTKTFGSVEVTRVPTAMSRKQKCKPIDSPTASYEKPLELDNQPCPQLKTSSGSKTISDPQSGGSESATLKPGQPIQTLSNLNFRMLVTSNLGQSNVPSVNSTSASSVTSNLVLSQAGSVCQTNTSSVPSNLTQSQAASVCQSNTSSVTSNLVQFQASNVCRTNSFFVASNLAQSQAQSMCSTSGSSVTSNLVQSQAASVCRTNTSFVSSNLGQSQAQSMCSTSGSSVASNLVQSQAPSVCRTNSLSVTSNVAYSQAQSMYRTNGLSVTSNLLQSRAQSVCRTSNSNITSNVGQVRASSLYSNSSGALSTVLQSRAPSLNNFSTLPVLLTHNSVQKAQNNTAQFLVTQKSQDVSHGQSNSSVHGQAVVGVLSSNPSQRCVVLPQFPSAVVSSAFYLNLPSNTAQSQASISNSKNASTVSLQAFPIQMAKSSPAQFLVSQKKQDLPQSVSSQHSHPQHAFSLPQTPSDGNASNAFSSNNLQRTVINPSTVLPKTQSSVVLNLASSHSKSLPSFSAPILQSSNSNKIISTHSQTLSSQYPTLSVQSLSSALQSNQQVPNPQTVLLNNPTVSTQQAECAVTQANAQSSFCINPNTIASQKTSKEWKFFTCSPIYAVFKPSTSSSPQQPANLFTPTVSKDKMIDPVLNKNPCPHLDVDSKFKKTPDQALQSSSTGCTTGQSWQINHRLSCELPVKASADSVCEPERNSCLSPTPVSPTPLISEESDSNLPTSTVSETDLKDLPVDSPPTSLPDPHIASTDYPANQTFPCPTKSKLESEPSPSSLNSTLASRWIKELPTKLINLLTETKTPSSNVKLPHGDSVPGSGTKPHQHSIKTLEKETLGDDNSVKLSSQSMSEEKAVLEDCERYLHVSLLRLPISGSPPPQFRIIPCKHESKILLQEIQQDQLVENWLCIPAPLGVTSQTSCNPMSSESPLSGEVLDCVVCLSAGASLQCVKCGRSFHTECHVPPIISNCITLWFCSLCQDMFDEADPFSQDRIEDPLLSVQDQRKCEQLLLYLMCDENCYLLYETTEEAARYVEFDFILKRMLGKSSPPFRSAAEMVSDLWTLFDVLLQNSEKKDLVFKLQHSFQKKLNVLFKECLHASLLKPCSSKLKAMPEVEKNTDKSKNTLKRMREFFAASSTVLTKKPHINNS